jgi:uncharacterized protein DUF5335
MARRVLHGIRKLTGVRAWVSERDELRANGTMRPRQALLNDVPRSRETYPGYLSSGAAMRIEEVPPADWINALNEFTLTHEGWMVSMAMFPADEEPRTAIRNLPLIGVSADRIDDGDIAISVARSSAEHLTHVIEHASRVYLQRGHNGGSAALIVDSEEGLRTVLRVRARAEAAEPRSLPRRS